MPNLKLNPLTTAHSRAQWLAACAMVATMAATPVFAQTRTTTEDALAACRALVEISAIEAAVPSARMGEPDGAAKLSQHAARLKGMVDGKSSPALNGISAQLRLIDSSVTTVTQHQAILRTMNQALIALVKHTPMLAEQVSTVAEREREIGSAAGRVDAAHQLEVLIERLHRHAQQLESEQVSPEAIFHLGKDMNAFKSINAALIDGSKEPLVPVGNNARQKERLQNVAGQHEALRRHAGSFLSNLQAIVAASEAAKVIRQSSAEAAKQLSPVCG